MNNLLKAAMLVIAGCASVNPPSVLEARFIPVAGANLEYAQGAVERCEALHRPLSDTLWVIVDAQRATAQDWERRLNEAVMPGVGRFVVIDAGPELRRRVAAGEIELQR